MHRPSLPVFILLAALCGSASFARAGESDPNCQDDYPKYVRLFVAGEQQWEGDRLSFTKMKRAEVFVTKGRYSGQILYPVAALFDEYPASHFVRFDACGVRYEDISRKQVEAEPWRYYLWNRKVQNGYLKFMDFGDTLKDSSLLEPIAEAEQGESGPGGRRILGRGISGNPEVIRFIHTIYLSKDPLPAPAAQAEPDPAPAVKPGKGKGKGKR